MILTVQDVADWIDRAHNLSAKTALEIVQAHLGNRFSYRNVDPDDAVWPMHAYMIIASTEDHYGD